MNSHLSTTAAFAPAVPDARLDSRPIDTLLNDRDVCTFVNCARSTLWRWVAQGDFPKPLKIGGMSRWKRSTVEQFLDKAEAEALAA